MPRIAIPTAGFHLINREQDLGDFGLCQAKLSYSPLDITPAFDLTLRADMDQGGKDDKSAE